MNELRNIDVHIISIVDKGANKKNVIWKSDDSGNKTYVHTFQIKKTNDEKQIVYGIVYSPNEEDAHGDFATEQEIEKACYNFMKKSKTTSVDKQHDLDTEQNLFVGENWIVKNNDSLFPDEVGAWAVGIKVENDEIWKSVKNGEFTGISMYGYAEKVQKNSDDEFESKFKRFFKKLIAGEDVMDKVVKDFNDRIIMLDFPKLLDALYSAAYDVLYDENIADKTVGILECVDQFKLHLANIEKSKAICKAGKMISESNMSKLKNAYESLGAILDAADKSTEKRDLQKSEIEKIKNKTTGEIEMTSDEIKKQIDDAVKPLAEANATLKTENEDLKKRLDDVEKQSKGSTQVHGDGTEPKEEVKKSVFPWGGGVK